MKKECAHTRKSLPKYLHGHLFKLEQVRIERHLKSCVVCYSEYQALKRADETRKYLKDITPPEGVVQRMKEGVTGLAKLKKLLYRPLWVAGIVIVAAIVYYYVSRPRQLDVELESIAKTAPSSTAPTTHTPAASAVPPVVVQPSAPVHVTAHELEPLAVSITTENDKTAIRRINAVMAGHGQLRKYKFTDKVREISGSLTTKELRIFFNQIESVGKVTYNRKRFESFPSAQPIPFVVKLTIVTRAPEEKEPPVQPVKKAREAEPPPFAQPAQKPVEAAVPSPPVTAPTPSAVQ